MNASRRKWSAAVLWWLAGAGLSASANAALSHELAAARSLPDELAAALKLGGPLVVMVSLAGCAYCDIVRKQYLQPMVHQGLSVVQVNWRSSAPLRDFGGAGSHDDAVRRWGIRVAPTLLFLGSGGREVAPRLAGVSSLDFYGAYLDARIEQARRAVRS